MFYPAIRFSVPPCILGDEPHWDAFTHGLTAAQEHHQTGLLSTLFSTRSRLLTSNLTSSSQGITFPDY